MKPGRVAEIAAPYGAFPRRTGKELTTIDLFCGAGGLAEGFRQAGFACLYANDFDPWAVRTFQENHRDTWTHGGSIEEIDTREVRKKLGLRRGALSALIGGPPCQGFSINAPERFVDDPRNSLFKHYLRFVDEFEPGCLVFENVPGILSLAGGVIFDRIGHELTRRGYHVTAKVLFAAHYGVPQERWRVLIFGSRLGRRIEPPWPTHYALGRANFRGSRQLTFQLEPLDRLTLAPQVTVEQAISDLPRLAMGEGGEVVQYGCEAQCEYARALRNPEGCTFNHFAARLSPQNVERLKHVKPGGSWRDIPFDLLPKGMQRARRSDHTKRYGRLTNSGLAATIMTKCDPHWGPVFLPDQERALTVREAARLQSFPDRYRFFGPRVAQYQQVGNAVPVLLARAIGWTIAEHLGVSAQRAAVG
jgi:DNA (cytosine-5)-methyltransferase 1